MLALIPQTSSEHPGVMQRLWLEKPPLEVVLRRSLRHFCNTLHYTHNTIIIDSQRECFRECFPSRYPHLAHPKLVCSFCQEVNTASSDLLRFIEPYKSHNQRLILNHTNRTIARSIVPGDFINHGPAGYLPESGGSQTQIHPLTERRD